MEGVGVMKHAWKGLILVMPLLLAFTLPAYAGNVTETISSISKQTATVSAVNTVTSITARSSMMLGFGSFKGLSSGNGDNGIGLWAMGNAYWLDKSGSNPYDGDMYMVTAGIDKQIDDDLLIGLSIGGEWTDLGLTAGGKYKSNGFTVAPYASYMVRDDVMVDFSVGYSTLSNDLKVWDIDDNVFRDADYNSWRLFTAGGVSKSWESDAWRFSSRLGALYLHQSGKAFDLRSPSNLNGVKTEEGSNYDLFQLQLGGRVGYDFGNVTPFVGVTYFQDIAKTGSSSDMVGADFDLGLNWKPNSTTTVGLTGTYGIRENFDKYGGMLSIRFDF